MKTSDIRVRGVLGEEEVREGYSVLQKHGEEKINTKLALHAAKQWFTGLSSSVCGAFIQRRGCRATNCTLI